LSRPFSDTRIAILEKVTSESVQKSPGAKKRESKKKRSSAGKRGNQKSSTTAITNDQKEDMRDKALPSGELPSPPPLDAHELPEPPPFVTKSIEVTINASAGSADI